MAISEDAPAIKAGKGPALAAIEFRDASGGLVPSVSFQRPSKPVLRASLELGEEIEGGLLILRPAPGVTAGFEVEGSFETSLTVADEGPHLDLIDWKHYNSDWVSLTSTDGRRFRIATISEADRRRFPATSPAEIVAAVSKRLAGQEAVTRERWVALARQCEGPNHGPCGIALSALRFRVYAKSPDGRRLLHVVEVAIPMGC